MYLFPVSWASSSILTSSSFSSRLYSLWPASTFARRPSSSSFIAFFFNLREWLRCSTSLTCCSVSEISPFSASVFFIAALLHLEGWILKIIQKTKGDLKNQEKNIHSLLLACTARVHIWWNNSTCSHIFFICPPPVRLSFVNFKLQVVAHMAHTDRSTASLASQILIWKNIKETAEKWNHLRVKEGLVTTVALNDVRCTCFCFF